MKNTFRVAFCGVISAFALVLMLLTGVIPAGTYALPCFAGILLTVVVIEYGARWSYTVFAVVSILSIFFASDKEAVIYFIAFFGFYPILKSTIERVHSKTVQYILKYAVFNVCVIAAFFVAKSILMIPDEEFTLFGFYVPWAFLLIGNVFFFFYDKCVTILIIRYIKNMRDKLFKI